MTEFDVDSIRTGVEFERMMKLGGFTEEVDEVDTRSTDLKHTDIMPPGSGIAKMPPRVYKKSKAELAAEREAEELKQPSVTILKSIHETTDLNAAAKKVKSAAEAMGWKTRAFATETHHEAVFYVSTTDEHDAGSIRYPPETRLNIMLEARAIPHNLGFSAFWAIRTRDGKKDVTIFEDATARDPIGFWKNDVATHIKTMKATKEFYLWMDDYLKLLAMEYGTLSTKPRKTKLEKINESILFDGEDWTG